MPAQEIIALTVNNLRERADALNGRPRQGLASEAGNVDDWRGTAEFTYAGVKRRTKNELRLSLVVTVGDGPAKHPDP